MDGISKMRQSVIRSQCIVLYPRILQLLVQPVLPKKNHLKTLLTCGPKMFGNAFLSNTAAQDLEEKAFLNHSIYHLFKQTIFIKIRTLMGRTQNKLPKHPSPFVVRILISGKFVRHSSEMTFHKDTFLTELHQTLHHTKKYFITFSSCVLRN